MRLTFLAVDERLVLAFAVTAAFFAAVVLVVVFFAGAALVAVVFLVAAATEMAGPGTSTLAKAAVAARLADRVVGIVRLSRSGC